jgi:hypothetical protein
MTRRAVVATLWFVAFALAGEILWSIGVTPRPLGLLVAPAIAAFVWLDPIHQLHPRTERPSPAIITARPTEAGLQPR